VYIGAVKSDLGNRGAQSNAWKNLTAPVTASIERAPLELAHFMSSVIFGAASPA
jgi:hypothetical protein